MSETASTGTATGATTGTQSAPAQASGQGQGTSGGQAAQAQGAPNTGQAPGAAAPAEQQRVLAEQDLDAYIEHTINGRKEKIKVRDALKGYGLDKTANQKMEQAANERKRTQQLMHLMQTDFDKYCEVTGTNKDEFLRANLSKRKEIAEEILAREYELQHMDPNQRKALELEQQLAQMKSQEMKVKQPIIDEIKKLVSADRLPPGLQNATADELKGFLAQRQHEFQAGVDHLSGELLDAWQKVGLPKEKDFGAWMAQVMLDHERRTVETRKRTGEELPPLHPEQAAHKVKERFLNSTRALLSQMDAPAIQEMLGEAIVQKLRDHDVGLVSRQSGPSFADQHRPGGNLPASEPKKYLSQTEWRKHMGIG